MKKIKFTVNLLDSKEVFSELKSSKGFPEAPDIDVEVELDDIAQNYEYLCKSPLIKKWEFTNEEDKKEQEKPQVKDILSENDINLKDVRDVIMLANAYFCVSAMKNETDFEKILEETIKYYQVNKDSIREKVYSEEFISNTIKAISETQDPVEDFLKRLSENTDLLMKDEVTFEEYYKKLYEISE